jgi:hypothetical protein
MVLIDASSSVSCAQPRLEGIFRRQEAGEGGERKIGSGRARGGRDVADDVAWACRGEYSRLLGCNRRPATRFTFGLVPFSPRLGSIPAGLTRQQRRDDVPPRITYELRGVGIRDATERGGACPKVFEYCPGQGKTFVGILEEILEIYAFL